MYYVNGSQWSGRVLQHQPSRWNAETTVILCIRKQYKCPSNHLYININLMYTYLPFYFRWDVSNHWNPWFNLHYASSTLHDVVIAILVSSLGLTIQLSIIEGGIYPNKSRANWWMAKLSKLCHATSKPSGYDWFFFSSPSDNIRSEKQPFHFLYNVALK